MTRRPARDGRPPALVRLVLRFLLPEEEREFFLGDLQERRPRSWVREIFGALALRLSSSPRPGNGPRARPEGILHELVHDVRYALRTMVRSPGFTLVALVTVAVGIGANTAMFSVVNGVILRPLPYPEPDRLVLLYENEQSRGWSTFSIAPLDFWDWQQRNRSLESLAAYRAGRVNYTGGDQPRSIPVYRVSDGFLEMLGAQPTLGRGILAADRAPGAPGVVVLTHGFWQRAFGADPDVLGRTMILDGVPHTVVGVLPGDWPPFLGVPVDVLVPLTPEPFWYEARGSHFLYALGRLRPGVSLEQARSDFSSIAAALEKEHPDTNTGWGATVLPLEDVVLGSARPQLLVFLACVGLVLLIACANLANMMLARGTVRGRELAIRTAIGAGRGRVVRQLLTESTVLAAAGGLLGVALAYVSVGAFVARWPTMLPRTQEIGIDGPVLLFSLGLSLASGVLFGLLPALSVSATDVADALRHGERSLAGARSRRWMHGVLVAGEVAMAVMLLTGTGLLMRSYAALQREDPGFRRENRLVLSTPLPRARYASSQDLIGFADAALARLKAVPGVRSAALASLIPLGGRDNIWGFWLDGNTQPGAQADGSALFYRVSPGYFEAMGIPLLAGRRITAEDREDGPGVALISASLARRYFGGKSPVGEHLWFNLDDREPPVEIVGVVGDVQHYRLGRTSIAQIYVPFRQRPTESVSFVVETSVPPASLSADVRRAIGDVDPDLPIVGMRPADALLTASISLPRFRTLLMTGFGLVALLLAVVGLYGVLAYSVSQRTKEFGVRIALGAARGSVLGLVFRQGLPLVGVGVVVGLAGAFALSRILKSMLFGVGTHDPRVFVAVPLIIVVVATAAMLVPARRATRVDPIRALGDA